MTETEKLEVRNAYLREYPCSLELKKKLRSLAVRGRYNLFLFMHLGDDFIRLNIKEEFERQYGRLYFIIPPNEVFLMRLFNIGDDEYTVFDYKEFLSGFVRRKPEDGVILDYMYMAIVENSVLSVPNTYEPFICWTNNLCSCKEYEERFGKPDDIFSFVKACLGIISDRRIDFSLVSYPGLSAALAERLAALSLSPERTVLFLPEVRSDSPLNTEVWEYLAARIGRLGYTVVENSAGGNGRIRGCSCPGLSLEELGMLAMRCRAIFSLRSGLCDIFAPRGRDLYVFWTRERLLGCGRFFSFGRLYDFGGGEPPREIILERGTRAEIPFDGADIGDGLRQGALPRRYSRIRGGVSTVLSLYRAAGASYALKFSVKRVLRKLRGRRPR